jgi:hypothetical protein
VRENPGRLSVVKRRIHRHARGDPGSPVAVQAELLCVVTGLAIGGVRKDVRGVTLHKVRVMKTTRFLCGVASGADLLGMALCTVHGATGGRRAVTGREIGRMERECYARRTDAKPRSHARTG